MPATRPVPDVLAQRARSGGGRALLTHYRPDRGERTELSVTSFANWVDKTANLLDDLGVDADASVALPVLLEAPAHWMALVWPFALWQRGLAAQVVGRSDAATSDLAVIGPDHPEAVAADTLACSLHPWALPLTGLPGGVTDYCSEALAQPDAHVAFPATPDALAWRDAERSLTVAEVAALPPLDDRVIAQPTDAWASVSLVVRAILGGGSVVLVDGPGDVARVAADERALRVVG